VMTVTSRLILGCGLQPNAKSAGEILAGREQ